MSLLFLGHPLKSRLCDNPFCLQWPLSTIFNLGKWNYDPVHLWTFSWINHWNWEGDGSISGATWEVYIPPGCHFSENLNIRKTLVWIRKKVYRFVKFTVVFTPAPFTSLKTKQNILSMRISSFIWNFTS